jgi:hypothetical protein
MLRIDEQDDSLHAPTDSDPWWGETYWFSFDQPGCDVSATIYPLFRHNQGVCSLGVSVWDGSAHEPWRILYGRSFWHLPMPAMDLTALRLQGLTYDTVEPLRRYRVGYHDAELIDLELEVTGLRPPHVSGPGDGIGHIDQSCHVVGTLRLGDRRIEIDSLGMRDRTWSPRPELKRGPGAAYTYGHVDADEQFLVYSRVDGNSGSLISGVFSGYLVRDGVESDLATASRRVVERRNGYPVRVEIEATDALGRHLEATGSTRNRLANQASPASFAWMSMTEWRVGGRTMIGEDQEVWRVEQLGGMLDALNT